MSHLTRSDLERFRDVIALESGLLFENGKLDFLGELLERRLKALGADVDVYLRRLESGDDAELAVLAKDLTVGETYFFRNADQLRACVELCVPARMAAQSMRKHLRILCAGCASGEEPYSLAILLRGVVDATWTLTITGADINPAALEKAAHAQYSVWSLRETSAEMQQRWFQPVGRDFLLDDSIRSAVNFEQRNLVAGEVDPWPAGHYDIVFCRNVLMYLSPLQARNAMGRLTRALAPGGYLFLGHAETMRGLSDDFHLRHTHDTFYYQRRGAEKHPAAVQSPHEPSPRPSESTLRTLADAEQPWVEAIQQASKRIEALTARRSERPTAGPGPTARPITHELRDAIELLRSERFADALALMQALPTSTGGNPDALLLRAVLLTHRGQLLEAEEMCAKLLALDELNAGAHYVLALCREGAGDRKGSAEHDHVAAYLDPMFAMPRLHAGLLARHEGNLTLARRELEQALVLLRREDASRLLLFGGGFTREALISVCTAALDACGGGS